MEKRDCQVFNFTCKICDCTDQEIKTTDYQTFVKCVQCGYVTVFDNEDIDQDLIDHEQE